MPQIKSFDEIKNNKLFKEVSHEALKSLSSKSFIGVREGDIIFQSGEDAHSVFLIADGTIKVKFSASRNSEVVKKKRNDFFGEKEILEKTKRISSAVAETDAVLFSIKEKELKKLLSKYPAVKKNLFSIHNDEENDEILELDPDSQKGKNNFNFADDSEKLIIPPHEEESIASEEMAPLPKEQIEDIIESDFKEEDFKETDFQADETTADDFNLEVDDPSDWNFSPEPDDNQNYIQPDEAPSGPKENADEEIPADSHDDLTWDFENLDFTKDIEGIEDAHIVDSNFSSGMTEKQFQLIIEAAQKVNSNVQIDKVLDSIVEAACSLTGAERGTLYIVDKDNNELWSKVLSGGELKEIRLKIGEGLAGSSAERNEIINLTDAHNDSRFNPEYDKVSGYQTKSMLCFPINNKEQTVVAVLQLLNSDKGSFTSLDEDFLTAISINAALALQNAELVEKLLHTDRMSSLGKMASFLIQDIKRPILTIKHYADHIKKKNVPADIKQVLDMLTDQANTVISLVQSTLSYSEGKALLQTSPIRVNDAMDNILGLLAEFVESRSVKLFKKYEADAVVNIDEKEFYQACFQITKNACDAMAGGGNIYLTVLNSDDDNFIKIEFKDQGLGIPFSIIDRIFDPFMSHGKKNGTGLGLAITEKIIKDHGGYITVESDLGEGAVFSIHLPVVSAIH